MSKIKKSLLDKIDLFNEVFSEVLTDNKYVESSLLIDRLENEGLDFPVSPVVQSNWICELHKRSFSFRLYSDYYIDFEFINWNNEEKLSFNAFKKTQQITDIELYLMNGELDDKFKEFLLATLNLLNSSKLLSVLKGEIWIDIPFDWQGQK